MPKAVFNGKVIAESKKFERVEGNIYFPKESVKTEYLSKSDTPYTCPWKGECQYYNVKVGDKEAKDSAFEYPDPKPLAENIRGHIAFWRDVKVEE